MDKRIAKIAKRICAKRVGKLPDVSGSAFDMARLARLMQARLSQGVGNQPQRANCR
jgi:hypothetical protein